MPTHFHAAYGLRQVPYFIGRYILRRNLKPERLYERDDSAIPEHAMDYDEEKKS